MKQSEIDNWRVNMQSRMEELTVLNAKHNQDIMHVKESVDELKELFKEQNGRVRELEGNMSGVRAIGAMLSVVFSGLFGYLFTKV